MTLLIVNSANLNATTLQSIFSAAGADKFAYTPAETTHATSSWPTLGSMISSNKRLVVFIASLAPASNTVAPYLLDEFTFMFENNYQNNNATAFSCEVNRPSNLVGMTSQALSEGYMPLMNHFRCVAYPPLSADVYNLL